jgi:hypothetical protein
MAQQKLSAEVLGEAVAINNGVIRLLICSNGRRYGSMFTVQNGKIVGLPSDAGRVTLPADSSDRYGR